MSVVTRDILKAQLQRKEMHPVYTLFGPEAVLLKRAENIIADRSFSEGDFRDFNDTTFSLNNENALDHALSAARQLPMMAAGRVVRIVDVRVSATGYRDTLGEKHEDLLSAYFADPSPHA